MTREGYNPRFIDETDDTMEVKHPTLSPGIAEDVYIDDNNNKFFDYIHFSVVMNKKARQLMYVASNIDQNKLKDITRNDDPWDTDTRIPKKLQLDNSYYDGDDNPYDRGHMVRRKNNCWADTDDDAREANNDTFFYTNASLQHQYFNRDEWLAVEDLVLNLELDDNGRLCVFTGPVWRPFDRCLHLSWDNYARIPSAFFKIICFKGKESKQLETRAFLLYQDEEFTNNQLSGSGILKSNGFAKYQVSVKDIENLTGLDFDDKIPASNPIYYNTPSDPEAVQRVYRYPERVPIIVKEDLVKDIAADRDTQEARDEDKTVDIVAALVNPEGYDYKKEWLSLFNKSNNTVNLKDWAIINQKGQVMHLDGEIPPGESRKLMTKDYIGFSLINNDGILVLRNKNGDTVDVVTYSKQDIKEPGRVLRF